MPSLNKRAAVCLAPLVFLLWSAGARAATVPDWVRTAAAASLPRYEAETNAVVLLDDTAYVVSTADEYTEHYRRVVKILRPEGRDQGTFHLHFRQKEKITALHAWSIDKAGHEYEVKEKEFAEHGLFDYDLYDDIRFRVTSVPASDPGSVVAFEYEVRRHPWLNHLDSSFQESVPVHEARVELQLSRGWEYVAKWSGTSPVTPTSVAGNEAQWVLHDLPAIRHEPLSPSRFALSARLELAYLQPGESARNTASWEAMGKWYESLVTGRRDPTPELSAKTRELVAGKTDFDGKVRALTSFLQSNIRYVAIEIGVGGFQPHTAQDVFRFRYGDCKDKATLLSSMLHEVGIESNYVIISTYRGVVHPEMPSPAFNHMILAIEVPPGVSTDSYSALVKSKTGKTYLIFDPTDEYTPLGELRGDLQDSYALLVAAGSGELIHTPWLQAKTNKLTRTGTFTLAGDGSLTGKIVEERSGDHALKEREAMTYANQREREQRIERRVNRSMKGMTIEKTEIQELDQIQQDLVISLTVADPGYGQVRGPLMLLRPRVLGEKAFALELKPRNYPFQFERASQETDTFEIELPKEFLVEDTPNPVKLDAGFASYESKIEVQGSKVKYWRELVWRDMLIAPERTEELRKFLGAIGADESAVMVLKRAM